MSTDSPNTAWIDVPDRERVTVVGNLAIGRTPASQVVLPDERVSRRHAIVHAQGNGEFWIVDHGSRNGTFVNDRRVIQPVRLRDGDRIRIGPFVLGFHQLSDGATADTANRSTLHTIVDCHIAPCWLLVADVEGSTALARTMPPKDLATLLDTWFKRCQDLIETHGGSLNKYLGDGFLAFWKALPTPQQSLGPVLDELRRLQQSRRPPFRFVLHHGEVLLGGGGTLGEDSLNGTAVNFVFRMEKLAGGLKQGCLLSEPAGRSLGPAFLERPLGDHPLPGFDGRHPMYGL
jgi:adenylate cyclase